MSVYPYRKISLQNIFHNFLTIKKFVAPAKIMAVIKSDAYGHSMLKVAQLLDKNVDYFLVDRLPDAIELRKNKITSPIFLACLLPNEIPACVKYGIEFVVSDWAGFNFLKENPSLNVKIHLKIDSGMGRLGFSFAEFSKILQDLCELTNVVVCGVYSHFAMSEQKENTFNKKQIKVFQQVVQHSKSNLKNTIFHLCNSGGIINFPTAYFSMVRTGLLLYGTYHARYYHNLNLKPALKLVSTLIAVKKIKKGSSVSYNHSWKAKQDGNLALVALGYGDGILRSLTNKAEVLIEGKRYPIVGNICMGMLAVFLGEDNNFKIGSQVVLLGSQKTQKISVTELAIKADSISHEILTSIGKVKNYFFV